MKKLIMMMFDGCPYCAKARKWVSELKKENPAYVPVLVEEVDENLHPEYAGARKLLLCTNVLFVRCRRGACAKIV